MPLSAMSSSCWWELQAKQQGNNVIHFYLLLLLELHLKWDSICQGMHHLLRPMPCFVAHQHLGWSVAGPCGAHEAFNSHTCASCHSLCLITYCMVHIKVMSLMISRREKLQRCWHGSGHTHPTGIKKTRKFGGTHIAMDYIMLSPMVLCPVKHWIWSVNRHMIPLYVCM
jgi:hypothetical protein